MCARIWRLAITLATAKYDGTAAALHSLQQSLDTAYASETKLASIEKTLAAARNEGLISIERENELLALATAKYAEAGAGKVHP